MTAPNNSDNNASESPKINYKETLLLPETTFKMKAGAATREPEIEQFWDREKIYFKAQEQRKASGAETFVLHDGPPYLSSDKIHIGTALNKILKDIVTRYQYQRGHYAPYVPGYDGHGLPIENAVVKSIKGGRKAISEVELRQKCRDFGAKNLKGQETNFKRLGVWGHWEEPYITTDPKFEATQIKAFYEMHKKGYVYKGLKPVYWCSHCETALADAEVEYDNHTSDSVYVKFPIVYAHIQGGFGSTPEEVEKIGEQKISLLKSASMVIWTTTPWTIPANLAQSVHPNFMYVVIQTEAGNLLIAEDLLEHFVSSTGLEQYEILGHFEGVELEKVKTQHPFIDRTSPVLNGRHVTLEAGTGVVHTAPGHGMEDYVICQQYDADKLKNNPIGIVSPVDAKGVFTEEAQEPRLIGQHYSKANAIVIEILKEKNALLGHKKIEHSYPHCWRCHQPVIYRATEQWFISIDKIRETALKEIKKEETKWIPERGEARIASMVEGRGDWCISRQRVWGVPIPVFYCTACDKPLINEKTTDDLYEIFCKESSDAWWAKSAAELLRDDTACECGSKEFIKETDIMDVWFDSGITHTAVVADRKEELGELPVELYLEGSDQHRGWFQSSLLTSVMLNGKAPFKTVLTHGFVLDGNGRKMSKSKGNVIDPNKIMNQYGADVLRLWVASVDYSVDMRIGDEIIKQLVEVYKKVRNTMRFMLGNLAGFDPALHTVPYKELSEDDKYILHCLQEVVRKLSFAFDDYQFHHYYQVLQNFCVTELSSSYFDMAKDVLYCDPEDGQRRRAMQTVLYNVFITLLPMLVPVAPHLAEDIWQNMPENQKPNYGFDVPPISIVMAPWPKSLQDEFSLPLGDLVRYERRLEFKDSVNVAIELARSEGVNKIKSSMEAKVLIRNGKDSQGGWGGANESFLVGHSPEDLASFFQVAQVEFVDAEVYFKEGLPVANYKEYRDILGVIPAKGQKCERCWNYRESVGTFDAHPTICERCHGAVMEMPEKASVT